jgi:hypothetical protein
MAKGGRWPPESQLAGGRRRSVGGLGTLVRNGRGDGVGTGVVGTLVRNGRDGGIKNEDVRTPVSLIAYRLSLIAFSHQVQGYEHKPPFSLFVFDRILVSCSGRDFSHVHIPHAPSPVLYPLSP